MNSTKGFTIVEIAVVIVIVSVLASLVALGFNRTLADSRNDSAKHKLSVLVNALNKYYNANGEYPTCAQLVPPKTTQDVASLLQGIDPATVTRHGALDGTNSLTCGTTANKTTFAYNPATASFTLRYQEDGTDAVVILTN